MTIKLLAVARFAARALALTVLAAAIPAQYPIVNIAYNQATDSASFGLSGAERFEQRYDARLLVGQGHRRNERDSSNRKSYLHDSSRDRFASRQRDQLGKLW